MPRGKVKHHPRSLGGSPAGDDLSAGGFADAPGDTWVVLLHRSTIETSVYADPRFGEHLAFLRRRADAGELVAAGSLADADGEGMTILRLRGEDRVAEATRLATADDGSVSSGLFEVVVRPWRVVLTGA